MTQMHTPKRRGRGCLLWLGGLGAGLLMLALLGALYESLAEAAEAQAVPPPGQLVDVGGHRLHLHCAGSGSPTVVIDAGLGSWSTHWTLVQSEVAKTTRVCTYDRAGMGWSEPGPLPRTAARFAQELHTLLQQADIPAPFVLVGHSLGGFPVRVFTHAYPAEVAGVVLVDSMSPAQFALSPADTTDTSAQPVSQAHAFSILPLLARLGVARLIVNVLGLVGTMPPEDIASSAYFYRPRNLQAYADESQAMADSAAQANAVQSFGDLPLIVLSRGLDPEPDWQAMQSDLLQLSSNSEQWIAEQSGHNIEIDQPQAAVAAIVKMVEQVR